MLAVKQQQIGCGSASLLPRLIPADLLRAWRVPRCKQHRACYGAGFLTAVVPVRTARERGARHPAAHAAADGRRASAEPRRPGRGILHGRVAAAARRRAPAVVPCAGGGRACAHGRRANARRADAHPSHCGACAAGRARARRRLGERFLGAVTPVGYQHASSVSCFRGCA